MGSEPASGLHKPAPDSGGLRVRTYGGTPEELSLLAAALRRGELVAIPTETVYGLAANALDGEACRRIFEVKGRPLIDPLIVHVPDEAQAAELAEVNAAARALMGRFWPGPLTLVLPRRDVVPAIVTAGLDTVALRSPRHPLARVLLSTCGLPLAAPSANPFGYVSPTCARHVVDGLGGQIDHLLDGGPCEIGLESTIVDVCDPARPLLLRPGAITAEDIAAVLGVKVARPATVVHRADAGGAPAPGMLERHYSPRTPLSLFTRPAELGGTVPAAGGGVGRVAVVFFTRGDFGGAESVAVGDTFWLSEDGSPEAAARQVFALLRRLDAAGYAQLLFQRAPMGGLGDAINDATDGDARTEP